MEDTLLTPAEVATKLRVNAATVRLWLNDGSLKASRAGKLWRIKQSDLDEFTKRGVPETAAA